MLLATAFPHVLNERDFLVYWMFFSLRSCSVCPKLANSGSVYTIEGTR